MGLPALMLREKDLNESELMELARELRRMTRAHNALFIVNNNVDAARASGADGIHLSFGPFNDFAGEIGGGLLCGVSCHSREELLVVQRLRADYALLAPVYAPLSKASVNPALGASEFGRMIRGVSLPVLALGGVTPERTAEVLDHGAAGIATIGGLLGIGAGEEALKQYLKVLGTVSAPDQ